MQRDGDEQGGRYRTGSSRIGTYTDIKTPTFRTSLNTGRFWAISNVPAGTEKKSFYLFIYLFLVL